MQTIYFISDAHLGGDSKELETCKTERLLTFFDYIRSRTDLLYIVGDLFDFWFEYRHAIPKNGLKVVAKLYQLVEAGVEIRYLAGNHDLWLGAYLETEIGVKIFHDPLEVTHNGLKLYIAHGDGLAKGDVGYRWLKRVFKNRVNIFLYRLLHPDLGIPIARYFSKKSKAKGENPFDLDYRNFATGKLQQGFDAIILGHTHKPLFERIDNKYYINLGDWITNFTYVVLSDSTFKSGIWRTNESGQDETPAEHKQYFKV